MQNKSNEVWLLAVTALKTILIWLEGDQRKEKKSDITETSLISLEFLSYNAMPARLPQREKRPTICSFRENSHQFRVYRRRRYICLKWDFSIASNLRFKCYGYERSATPMFSIGHAITPRFLFFCIFRASLWENVMFYVIELCNN